MRSAVRVFCIAALCCAAAWFAAPMALAAEPPKFGVASFEAGTCTEENKVTRCTKETPEKFYRQAAGHPNFGITDIKFNTEEKTPGLALPVGKVKTIRVDIPIGLSVNPEAVPKCTEKQLEEGACSLSAKLGVDEITTINHVTISATVYNIEPGPKHPGVPSLFGFNAGPALPALPPTYLVGGVSWHAEPESMEFAPLGFPTGDYHEFFTIYEIPESVPLIETRLITEGKAFEPATGTGPFITLPSTCTEHPNPTANVLVESWGKERAEKSFEAPVGATGCNEIPFKPTISVTPSTSQSDRPDSATVEVKVPQDANPEHIDSSTLKDAHVTLPEGMTLNPSAASGLEACTDAAFGKGTTNPVKCPAGSQVGTDTIETPDLPAKTLTGNVYVGAPLSTNPESGQEYRIFIDAEAPQYGVSVRLEGRVSANASTGQLTTAVLENPQEPFSDFIVSLGGPHTPLANPLVCGAATSTTSSLVPYNGNPAVTPIISFPVDFDGKGGTCPSPLPFALTQSASSSPSTGGSPTEFTLNLTRPEGDQYLSKVSVTLPPGLVGRIPLVALCGEPQAAQGTCPPASQIGTATAGLGAGPSPLVLSGPVYLTSGYGGSPYGLSVAVDASKVGPYDFGTIVTRASIDVDPHTARVTVSSALPTIVGGTPLRIRSIAVEVNRSGFTLNPTNCSPLATNTTLTSTTGSAQTIATPFQASGCDALAFAPAFTASTTATTSRANGASLTVQIGYPAGPQANIRSVVASLPKQLPSRLSTLNKACLASTFEANPSACPPGSRVGVATASTPVLPDLLLGPAYFVSHGGAAFPDLDLVLQGDGVTVILTGNTNISNGVTTSTFASLPDVPVSSFLLSLPAGPNSALAGSGLCAAPLVMPTTITAQNGKVVKQNTQIAVAGCHSKPKSPPHRLFRIISHRVRGHVATIVVQTYLAGSLRAGGHDLLTARRTLRRATRRVTLRVALSRAGLRALGRLHRHHGHRPHGGLRLRVRVSFTPAGARGASSAMVVVSFG